MNVSECGYLLPTELFDKIPGPHGPDDTLVGQMLSSISLEPGPHKLLGIEFS